MKGADEMALTADILRGYTETIILSRLKDGAGYGYQINKSISEACGSAFELKEATLYTAFRRLGVGGRTDRRAPALLRPDARRTEQAERRSGQLAQHPGADGPAAAGGGSLPD